MNPPKMPLHIGDYKRDTGHLRAAGHGAYLLLLMHYWSTGGLPDDDEQLASIACMTRAEWRKARPVISKFFTDGWKKGRVDHDLAMAKEKAAKHAEAGKRGGEAKAKAKLGSSENVARLDENSSEALATLLPSNLEESKKDAACAALGPDLQRDYYARGKDIFGKESGGLLAKLLKVKKGNVALARAALEMASSRQDPREYIGAILAGGNASEEGRRLTNDEVFYGVGRTPGII